MSHMDSSIKFHKGLTLLKTKDSGQQASVLSSSRNPCTTPSSSMQWVANSNSNGKSGFLDKMKRPSWGRLPMHGVEGVERLLAGSLTKVRPGSGERHPRAPHLKGPFPVLLYMPLTGGQGAQGPGRVCPPASLSPPLDDASALGTPEFSARLWAWVASTFETCRRRRLPL